MNCSQRLARRDRLLDARLHVDEHVAELREVGARSRAGRGPGTICVCVVGLARARDSPTRSGPSSLPPLSTSMNGKKPFTNVSPMCTTFAFVEPDVRSRRRCARAPRARRGSSRRSSAASTPSANVTTGSAAAATAGILRFISLRDLLGRHALAHVLVRDSPSPPPQQGAVPARVVEVPVRIQHEAHRPRP